MARKASRTPLTALLLCSLLVACAGDPSGAPEADVEYPVPPAVARAHASEAAVRPASGRPADGATASPAPKAAPAPTAPKVDPLTLKAAIARALKANRGLAGSRDHVEFARLSIASAESEFELKFIPGGEAGLSGLGDDTESNYGIGLALQRKLPVGTVASVTPGVSKVGSDYRTAGVFAVTQPLLRGLSREFNLAGVREAEFASRTAARSLYLQRVDTVLGTVGSVYSVIRQRRLVTLTEASARRLRGHAEACAAKEKIGLASRIDVYRARIQFEDARDALVAAREAHGDALDNLRVILALPLDAPLDVKAPLKYNRTRLTEEDAVRAALASRIELDQSRDAIRESRRRSRVARHDILPEINLSLSYTRFGEAKRLGKSASFDEQAWNVGVASTTDLARTAERIAYTQSLITVRAARRALAVRRDDVVRQVKRELRSLRRAGKRIRIQETQVKQAEGQLALANIKFRRGLANNFDQIQAESELRRAQTNLISAVVDYIVGRYRLRAAVGSLLEKPRGL